MKIEFQEHFIKFIEGAKAKVQKNYDENYPNAPREEISFTIGPKYIRVTLGHSAYCFIDLETGRVWKPAGWKAAERKNPRSCIFDKDYGLSGVTAYGTTYLR